MNTRSTSRPVPSVAATLAGEDIECGEYIAVLTEAVDLPSYIWGACGLSLDPEQLIRLKFIPCDAGEPLKVFAVCLPFVYAKTAGDLVETVDLRQAQIVRLDSENAEEYWRAKRPAKRRKSAKKA